MRGTTILIAATALFATGCTQILGIPTVSEVQMSITGGDAQSGIVGTTLSAPLVATVQDADGQPLADQQIMFTVVAGGGSISASMATTDAQGQVQTTLTLGTTAGMNGVEAHLVGFSDSVSFTAMGLPGPATRISAASGDAQSAVVGSTLVAPLIVRTEDTYGNAVSSIPVDFVVIAGGGTVLQPAHVTTDAAGNAQAYFTLGTAPGSNMVEARAAQLDGSPVQFHETAIVGAPDHVTMTSGDGQSGTVASTLTAPFVVSVQDMYANPVSNVNVTFEVTAGNGSLAAANVMTDSNGQAQSTLTLGTIAGANKVEAQVSGVSGSPVTFTATGDADAPNHIMVTSGDNQSATVASTLAPFVATVTDVYANPVPNATVAFVVTAGGGSVSPTSAVTDTAGQVQTNLTLGTTAGPNTVEARVSGLTAVFNASGMPGSPTQLVQISGDGQASTLGTTLAPFVAAVEDVYGNGVPNVTVTFASTRGDGTISPTGGITTDANGQAQTTLTLGNSWRDTVEAQASGLSPVVFTALAEGMGAKTDVSAGAYPSAVAVGDLNGDGRPDLAVANYSSSSVSVLLNKTTPGSATTTFPARADYATGSNPYSVVIADLNGDGRPDLVVANYNSGTVSVFLNKTSPGAGNSFFAAKVDFATGANPHAVAVADFNGDGKIDIALAATSVVSVLLNTTAPGAANPTFAARVDFPATSPTALATGDLNGDGKPDLAVASSGTSGITSVLLNTTAPGASAPTFAAKVGFAVGQYQYGVAIGDLNGDGKPDVAVANYNWGGVSVLINTTTPGAATPTFTNGTSFYIGANQPSAVAIGDLNGDGKQDLVVANQSQGRASLLLNTTAPGASTPTFAPRLDVGTGSAPDSVAIGDFNGDGKSDLVVADFSSGNNVSTFINTTGWGRPLAFSGNVDLGTGVNTNPRSVAIADFNADGMPDIATASYVNFGPTASVFLSSTAPGALTPNFPTKADVTPGSYPFANAADVNGDGRPDLIVVNYGANSISVFMNATTPGATTPAFGAKADFGTASAPYPVAVGDLNGDGKPDLVVPNVSSSSISVLFNATAPGATTASFATKVDFATGSTPEGVAIADLNGDGAPDVAVANAGSNTVSVFINTTAPGGTTPSFATRGDVATGSAPEGIAAADLNGDGMLDLVVADWSGSSVSALRNITVIGSTVPSFSAKVDAPTGSNPTAVYVADLDGDGRTDVAVANSGSNTVSVLPNATAPGAVTLTFATRLDFTSSSTPAEVVAHDLNGDGTPDLVLANGFTASVSILLGQ